MVAREVPARRQVDGFTAAGREGVTLTRASVSARGPSSVRAARSLPKAARLSRPSPRRRGTSAATSTSSATFLAPRTRGWFCTITSHDPLLASRRPRRRQTRHAAELKRECDAIEAERDEAKATLRDLRAALLSEPLDPPPVSACLDDAWRCEIADVKDTVLRARRIGVRIEASHKPQTVAWHVITLPKPEG